MSFCLSDTISLTPGRVEDPIPGGGGVVVNCDFFLKGTMLTIFLRYDR